MKSTILSLFILISIFMLFKYGALSVLGSQAFHVTAFAALAVVLAAAAYFVGFGGRTINSGQTEVPANTEDETDEK